MAGLSPWEIQIPFTVALAALAAIGYIASLARNQRAELCLLDVLVLVTLMLILAGSALPVVNVFAARAQQSALKQNLYTLRSQIELYRLQHAGRPPLLLEGTLPQLTQPTDGEGVPGPPGSKHPFGPYFNGGLPINPLTASNSVTASDDPGLKSARRARGWVYDRQTGHIAPDLPGGRAKPK